VLLLPLAALVGLAVGRCWATGRHAARPAIQRSYLLAAGVALRLAVPLAPDDVAPVMLTLAIAVLAWFAAWNLQLTGMGVIAAGLLANLLGVVANSGMPVRPGALVAAGIIERSEVSTVFVTGARHLERPDDPLPIFGDVLPIGAIGTVISFGDLVIFFGLADTAAELTRRRRRVRQATTKAIVVHDWGWAPRPAPEPGSQCSENPDRMAPSMIDLDSESATDRSSDLVAASHSR
jgi:hypothetical protein